MAILSRDLFRVSVVIYPEDDAWIAQGLQFDITARGRTPDEASERFNDKFGAELVMSTEIGEEPLSGVGSAPLEFWNMYKNSMRVAHAEERPIRLTIRCEWLTPKSGQFG